jgi:hypothetical protein
MHCGAHFSLKFEISASLLKLSAPNSETEPREPLRKEESSVAHELGVTSSTFGVRSCCLVGFGRHGDLSVEMDMAKVHFDSQ